jgi:CBS domain-containing protein
LIDNEREVLISNLLKTHYLGGISKKDKGIVSMPSNQPVVEAAKLMVENQVGSIIIKNDQIEGIITKGDIIQRVVGRHDFSKPLGINSTNDILKFAPGLLRIHRERLLMETVQKRSTNNNSREEIEFEGFCDDCGNYSDSLKSANGYTLCPTCIGSLPEEDQSPDEDIL